ncbi:MAG: TRAP transporter substrate-binding protein [Sutterellaceae bacterium]|nr:TRAP transporter substrate-binding protein [Burkholderiaceae bacterium]MCX7902485.1 TRAP transporter substrate-binding protein [Burkholderiaceae bacterium]MDW8430539.1 TRAP transporter substrate-binding protein [Sutterellaceae bacterium]
MKRRAFLRTAGKGAGMAMAALAAPAVHAQASIRWRLASSFPKSLDTIFGSAELFAKFVRDATGGKFEISVHAAGELVPAFGVADAVQNGTVECAQTAPYYFYGKDEAFSFDCAIPFGLNARQQAAWMFDGNGMRLMREFYRNYNIVNFVMGNTGAQMGGWYRKEIKSLDDLKGLKMRISNLAGVIMSRLGVIPQTIPGGEAYTALEKGTIDALEWVGPYDDERLGFNKVARYYYYPAWWEGGAQLALYINSKSWDALPSEYKAIIEAAATHAHVVMQARYDARNPAALKRLVASGTILRPMPRPIMEAAYKTAEAVYAELAAKNPNWKKIWDDWSRFRSDQVLWFRVAEREFDNFMSAQKL